MKKNLKKVISAIAALALSTSSFVALAADFPDVPDTADYAKAVDQLTGMGIVEGDPDGTFQPDRAVTRAEMTAMIIRALGSENAANSMAGRDTVFSDVDHNHWAAGYVAVANTTNPMFIQGMGDGTFAPDATVTYAQAITMLVRAVGYESWANQTAWPNGYLAQAGTLNITDGFAVVSNDTELNRGQVAILIDNTIVNAPILGEGEWQTNYLTGQAGYTPEVKDGTNPFNRNFWTTLGTKLDVYQVYGTVTGTRQTGAAAYADEVKFTVSKAKNFDMRSYGYGFDTSTVITANIGDTNADQLLNQYSEALIEKVDDDDYVILSITPGGGRTVTEDYAANQYDKLDLNSRYVYFYDEDGSNSRGRRLTSNDIEWFVNDFPVAEADAVKYLENNYVGDVQLLDNEDEQGNTGSDGKFDSIMITYYQDAVVDEVTSSSSGVVTVTFLAQDDTLSASLKIDPEDDDRVVKFQGDAESVEDLMQYDVLSIQAQPGVNLANSDNVTVTVSRETASGQLSRTSTDDLTGDPRYYIGDGSYTVNSAIGNIERELESAVDYTLYLDAFGYISWIEEGVSSKTYAVIDRMFVADGGSTNRIKVILPDGTTPTYDYYRNNEEDFEKDANLYAYNGDFDVANGQVIAGTLKPVKDRVVTYTETSKGFRITGQAEPREAVDAAYNLNSNRVGSVRMNDNTVALDLVDYVEKGNAGDVSIMGSFQDDQTYTAYGYGKSATDDTYKFVIVTDGVGGISMESPFAVISSVSTTDYGDGNTTAFTVYTNGDVDDLIVDIDCDLTADQLDDFGVGDAFIYEVNGNNRITDMQMVYDLPANSGVQSYGNYIKNVFTEAMKHQDVAEGTSFDCLLAKDTPTAANYKDFGSKYNRNSDYAYFTLGPVLATSGGVTLGTLKDLNGAAVSYMDDASSDYGFDDAYVYTYDWSIRTSSQRVETGSRSSIQRSNLGNSILQDGGDAGDYVDWAASLDALRGDVDESKSYNQTSISMALLKIYSGDITEGYSIMAPR